jgi:hypothetical protein
MFDANTDVEVARKKPTTKKIKPKYALDILFSVMLEPPENQRPLKTG